MLPLALWAPPSLQLHQAFPGTALAADTPEDHFSVHRRWTLPGAHRLTTERPLHTLSSLQHPAPAFPYPPGLLGSSVGSELPLGWGSSYTSSPHDSPSVPSQPSPDSRCHAEPRLLPGLSVLATFLVPNPLSHSFLKSGSFFVPFVFALTTFVISRAVWDIGDAGHCPLSSRFHSHPGQAAVPSGAQPWGLDL